MEPRFAGVSLALAKVGAVVHDQVRCLFYFPSPTGKVSFSALGFLGVGEGDRII